MVLGAPAGDRDTRRRIGYLPELFRFQGWLTAREVLALHSRLLRLPRPRTPSTTDDTLHAVGLAGRGDDKVGTFSKGIAAAPRPGRRPPGRPGPGHPGRGPPVPSTRSGGIRSGPSSATCATAVRRSS